MIEHPFGPLYDKDSRVLILGSFPSVKSREQEFFYGHPQNRFWNVIYNVCSSFDEIRKHPFETKEDKARFLHDNHIALWDVIASCDIEGSSDSSIRNVTANDLAVILNAADIRNIYVNGKTAEKYYNRYIRCNIGRECTVLPSTSPANAAWKLDRLIDSWRIIRDDF